MTKRTMASRWLVLALLAFAPAGCSRKAAPGSPSGVSGFADEEARAIAIPEKDAAGATTLVWEDRPERPMPKPEPKPESPRPPTESPERDSKPAPQAEVAAQTTEDAPHGPKRISRNSNVKVENWGPHYRFSQTERDRIEVHPAWHSIMRMDGFKGPPTVAFRCVFRVTDDRGSR